MTLQADIHEQNKAIFRKCRCTDSNLSIYVECQIRAAHPFLDLTYAKYKGFKVFEFEKSPKLRAIKPYFTFAGGLG